MIEIITLTGEVQGALAQPAQASSLGVLLLTGSSGRVDVERARMFAERGAVALAQRWWGGEGQAPGINLIPLEVFIKGIDRLKAEGCTRIAVLGTSRGAEAALLTAVRDARVDVAIAISPSHVVWQDFGPGLDGAFWPPRAAFSWAGRPLPCIIYDPRVWPAVGAPQIYRPTHEQSLVTFAEDVPAPASRSRMHGRRSFWSLARETCSGPPRPPPMRSPRGWSGTASAQSSSSTRTPVIARCSQVNCDRPSRPHGPGAALWRPTANWALRPGLRSPRG